MKLKTILKVLVFFIVIGGAALFSYQVGVFVGEERAFQVPPAQIANPNLNQPDGFDFGLFWEVWRKLEKNFLEKEKIDYQQMLYGAISGMVKSLGDPYTAFFTPKETEDFNEELSGKYEGVGMVVGIRNDTLTVISPFKGTPADKAGLRPGDEILKVDDTLTKDITIEEAVSLIKGPRDTEVRLLIQRKGFTEPKEFKMQRGLIKIPTLEWEFVESEEDIVYIKMYQFNKILPAEFKKAALNILESPSKKIVLDLRNNPGGYLEVAQEIAGWFLKKDDVVTWQDWGEKQEKKAYRSNGPSVFLEYPVVVLINEGSASGAEILAGALRDNRGVKLVGEKSFGKGSVQEQLSLSDGSSLKVTMAKWLTPKGTAIDGEGLSPDVEVVLAESSGEESEAEDAQLEKAIEILKGLG